MLIEPEDDGEEHFVDVAEDGKPVAISSKATPASSSKTYDGRKRDPKFADADTSCLWELVRLPSEFSRP